MVCLEDAHKMSLTAQKWETYRFTSKEFDRETGLYYFGARYYEPKLSNWMSADPAGFELINPSRDGYSVVEALNWYSYTSNNPLKYVDPMGMMGQKEPSGTPYFKNGMRYNPIDGLNHLNNAAYGPENSGGPQLESANPSPLGLLLSGKGDADYEQKVSPLEAIGRSLPTGMGDSPADATSGFLGNITNPDTLLEAKVTADYEGFGENRKITKWSLILPMLKISGENLDDGSNSHTIKPEVVPNKESAMDFMARNPEFIEGILWESGILEYKNDE